MFRELLVYLMAAFVFGFLMIPAFAVFSSLRDIFMYALAALFMVMVLMGAYVEYIEAFTRGKRK